MHNKVINIREQLHISNFIDVQLSFTPFVKYLQHRMDVEKTIKSQFYRLILNKFKTYPELEAGPLDPKDAVKYTDIMELIYTALSPTIEDEKKLFWALSNPGRSKIIFCTDAFYGFIKAQQKRSKKEQLSDKEFKERQIDFAYKLILQKLYKFPDQISNDTVHAITDAKTSLTKYYRVHTDSRFVDVVAKKALPDINAELIEPFIYDGADVALLKDLIPLNMFSFQGFSVVSMEDITAEYAVETIRLAMLNNIGEHNILYTDVINSLQILAGNAAIKFGLLPLLRINGRLIFDAEECMNSILIKTAKSQQTKDDDLNAFISSYIEKPTAMFFNTLSEKKITQYPFLKALKAEGISSYAILPVFYNKHLAGVLEIYGNQKILFYEKLLSQIKTTIPLLAQLLHNTTEQLEEKLESVIKNKFTTLQPAVQWKFNEAAWNYLKAGQETDNAEMEVVSFRDVYPLYGAIDIRDSTIKHNAALKADIGRLKNLLLLFIKELKPMINNKRLIATLESKQMLWLKKIKEFEKANDETMLKNFVNGTINPYFSALKVKYPNTEKLINAFEKSIDEKGETYTQRRDLEVSIKYINKTLSRYFEQAQNKLQKIYPCYFEKFRSDGIEYDIYTGQDIAPAIVFKPGHLTEFRYWQLKAMIDVAKLTNGLLEKMPIPLQTAALIFVHSSQIDICFRNDERRFDVEGYYNIRYEVIKKRIDKVHVKNTKERLTQPGKIAVVYFNDTEANEYIDLIKQFQKDKLLNKDMEFVELENLQGVTGLKAFRVGINYQ